MADDIITELSQTATDKGQSLGDPVFFPEIPDPPANFDPEAEPLFKEDVPHSERVLAPKKSRKVQYIPKAKVFLIGPEGDEYYEEILSKGIAGEYILGKKEIMDMRGSHKFKVYMEWIEIAKK